MMTAKEELLLRLFLMLLLLALRWPMDYFFRRLQVSDLPSWITPVRPRLRGVPHRAFCESFVFASIIYEAALVLTFLVNPSLSVPTLIKAGSLFLLIIHFAFYLLCISVHKTLDAWIVIRIAKDRQNAAEQLGALGNRYSYVCCAVLFSFSWVALFGLG